MERRQLEELIRLLMKENDRLYIPGFGVIQKHMQSAQYDKLHNRLLPPSYEFKLEDHLHYDDPYLADMFAWYADSDTDNAANFVQAYGEQLHRDLFSTGKSEIAGVAAFHRQGDVVSTTSDPTFSKTNRLPVLEIQDIWEEDVTRQQVWWEFSVFGVMLLLVLGFVYFLLYTGTGSPGYTPSIDLPHTIGQQMSLPDPVDEPDTIRNPVIENIPDEIITEYPAAQLIQSPSGEHNPVIIVGAFEDESNVVKMRKILEDRGWKVYEEQSRALPVTRIGFVLDQQEDIDSVLGLVRQEIEPGAWLLVRNKGRRHE
ncbi:MAG: hypothetical protein H6561_06235 [Lewinellaceae bacterium]|nr:hypothetical protein [Lewinellaceae bacterium]HQU55304.1 hypothetical protein [Saprospiraceae bacterium]